jgi:hypothetical protein
MYTVPESGALFKPLMILLLVMFVIHIHRLDQVLVNGLNLSAYALDKAVHGKLNFVHGLGKGINH